MPVRDLDLLIEASRAAGDVASRFWRTNQTVCQKDEDAGPVSEGDLAVNALLQERLTAARPGYGWLSEESEDDPARLGADTLFIVDPIDGTRAYVDGQETWAISIAVVTQGRPVAGVVYLPQRDKLYAAALGKGATLNGAAIQTGNRVDVEGAQVLAPKPVLEPRHWRGAVPQMKRNFRPSLAYRLCLVAEGRFDAMLTFRPTWDWDVAAGTLIAEEAGAVVSDATGAPLRFNSPTGKSPNALAAPPALHAALMDRMPGPAA